MQRFIAAALSTLLLGAPVARADADHVDLWRTARVSIDANGKVTSLVFVPAQKRDIVADKLDVAIRGWLFEPGRVNGKAAPTDTGLSLHLDLRKVDGDHYAVDLLGADTGATFATMNAPPRYPDEQLRNGTEAQILLRAQYDAEGKVTKTSVEDSAASGSSWDLSAFVRAVQFQAGSKWRFRPESVDGHGIAGAVLVPVSFCVHGSGSGCAGLQQKMAKHRAAQGLQTPSTLPMPLDRQARLLSQVAGTRL